MSCKGCLAAKPREPVGEHACGAGISAGRDPRRYPEGIPRGSPARRSTDAAATQPCLKDKASSSRVSLAE